MAPAELARELYAAWPDGRIKLFLIQAALRARKAQPEVFAGGGYVPLAPEGAGADNLVAFARTGPEGQLAVVVAPSGAIHESSAMVVFTPAIPFPVCLVSAGLGDPA